MPTSTTRSLSSTPPSRTRRLASLLGLAVALGCAVGGGPGAPTAESEIRVGLGVDLARVALGGEGGGELLLTADGGELVGSIAASASWTALPDSAGVRLRRPDGTLTPVYGRVAAVNLTEDRYATANGRHYRGRLDVVRSGLALTLVNRVPLEAYVVGVIGAEMGRRRDDEREALLAQAIVSRTIALRSRGRWESLGFDAYGDTRDQVYGGVAAESPAAWDAVRRTAGLVLRHDGELVEAFFHSTCGFSTAGAEEAFRTARGRPYLRPVSDARGGGYYCDISPRFRWREEWDAQHLRAILSRTLPAVMNLSGEGLQPVTNIEVSRTTPSGRVGELRIVFDRGDVRVSGSDVRQVLRPQADRWLGSAAFQLHVTREGGQVARVVAAGGGWGHGVGLCQWGAVGRARAGQDHRRILATYFPGTSVERAY